MTDISSWDTSAANNNSAPPDGFPELQAPSTVNNAAREVMAAVRRYYDDIGAVNTSGGSSNAYTLTASQTISAYAAGQWFAFVANHANTGAATLNVDSVGAKSIKKGHDQDLASDDIKADQIVVVYYQATDDVFEMVSNVATDTSTIESDITTLEDWRTELENSHASVYRSTDQGPLTNSVWTKIQFDSETYDVGSNFASSTYTVPSAGKYLVSAHVSNNDTGGDKLAIYKNGSLYARINENVNKGGGGSVEIDASSSDTFEAYAMTRLDDDTSISGGASLTWMTIARIA